VRIKQETKGTLRASIQYWDVRHGSVMTANWRGHKPRMRIKGRNRSEAFASKTLDEIVRIAEVFLVHLVSPALETVTYVSRARAPAPQSLASKNSSTLPKISSALFDS
jgi:hypothetical protein